jgi:hypothetical protein
MALRRAVVRCGARRGTSSDPIGTRTRATGHRLRPSTVREVGAGGGPGYTRGRWTEEEDMALRRAVVRCGVGNWAEVSERVSLSLSQKVHTSPRRRRENMGHSPPESSSHTQRWIEISEQGFQGRRTDNSVSFSPSCARTRFAHFQRPSSARGALCRFMAGLDFFFFTRS